MTHEAALEKLERLLGVTPVEDLKPEEIAIIREMITAWRGLTAMGWFVGVLRRWLWLVGLCAGGYFALRGKPDLLDQLMSGAPR